MSNDLRLAYEGLRGLSSSGIPTNETDKQNGLGYLARLH